MIHQHDLITDMKHFYLVIIENIIFKINVIQLMAHHTQHRPFKEILKTRNVKRRGEKPVMKEL